MKIDYKYASTAHNPEVGGSNPPPAPNEKPLNKAICAMLSGFCFCFKIAPRGEFWVNRFWILSVSLKNTGTDVFGLCLCFRYLMRINIGGCGGADVSQFTGSRYKVNAVGNHG